MSSECASAYSQKKFHMGDLTDQLIDRNRKVRVGICAMERKATSKPMRAILAKMTEKYDDYLEVITFDQHVILHEHPREWPVVDCLISFHSSGFPMQKAIDYVQMHKPYTPNDLKKQYDLLDRVKVYKTLTRQRVDQPHHVFVTRDESKGVLDKLMEMPDSIQVNGKTTLVKPFVEKPRSAEDHNVNIYFPQSSGGGCQKLFRKINNRSSEYSQDGAVRQEGSFIYEQFIPNGGTDIKVYAVGPFYAYAEARKSPALDGKVDRNPDGKEVRYPVILTSREKSYARKIVLQFEQAVCGFDLLRSGGKSYVIDVNGFSFVKSSSKYYDDTARILGNMILNQLAARLSIPWNKPLQQEDPPVVSLPSGKMMELRCVLAVIRHGDRTPKQKIKIEVTDKRWFQLFDKEQELMKKKLQKHIKMKQPRQLAKVLGLSREILIELRTQLVDLQERGSDSSQLSAVSETDDVKRIQREILNFDQVRTVLEMYGHFSGINRKVQMKKLGPIDPDKAGKAQSGSDSDSDGGVVPTGQQNEAHDRLLLIVKWGGELTEAGVMQAEALGKLFRTLYPGLSGRQRDDDKRGLGFLRLHSTYRHDLKIYASDEGRVQSTAAAFTKGMLALEGELPPILAMMVKSANMNGLLDDDWCARKHQDQVKGALHAWLQEDRDLSAADHAQLNPTGQKSLADALDFIQNPRKMCDEIFEYLQKLYKVLTAFRESKTDYHLYASETIQLAEQRWAKLLRDFRRVKKLGLIWYDISKIPDLYDNIKYDMEHNPDIAMAYEDDFERLYLCVKNMADVLVPSEYGMDAATKMTIGQGVCTPLIKKLMTDLKRCALPEDDDDAEITAKLDPAAAERLGISTPLRHVRTRLYFTSESHIHTLMNLLQFGGLNIDDNDRKWQRAMSFLSSVTEFNYMSSVVMMLYEEVNSETAGRPCKEPETSKFHIELLFSPGLYPCFQTEKERIYDGNFGPDRVLSTTFEPLPREKKKESSSSTLTSNNSNKDSNNETVNSTELKNSPSDSNGLHIDTNNSTAVQSKTVVLNSTQPSTVTSSDYSTSKSGSVPKSSDKTDGSSASSQSAASSTVKTTTVTPSTAEESDEETEPRVNLVALADIINAPKLTSSELAKSSPPISPKAKVSVDGGVQALDLHAGGAGAACTKLDMMRLRNSSDSNVLAVVKAHDTAVSQQLSTSQPDEASRGRSLTKTKLMRVDESSTGQRQIAYRFKHHTVNLLRDADNRLISTAVIRGDAHAAASPRPSGPGGLPLTQTLTKEQMAQLVLTQQQNLMAAANTSQKDQLVSQLQSAQDAEQLMLDQNYMTIGHAPVVLGTAVIGRSSSAPKLQTLFSGAKVPMGDIRRFWPPLRSLETLHDSLSFDVVMGFLHRVTSERTPAPTPPKTPKDISRENSDLNASPKHQKDDSKSSMKKKPSPVSSQAATPTTES